MKGLKDNVGGNRAGLRSKGIKKDDKPKKVEKKPPAKKAKAPANNKKDKKVSQIPMQAPPVFNDI